MFLLLYVFKNPRLPLGETARLRLVQRNQSLHRGILCVRRFRKISGLFVRLIP
nr:MAG TPA: hypothetical protein [Bacteriophage sp.]